MHGNGERRGPKSVWVCCDATTDRIALLVARGLCDRWHSTAHTHTHTPTKKKRGGGKGLWFVLDAMDIGSQV